MSQLGDFHITQAGEHEISGFVISDLHKSSDCQFIVCINSHLLFVRRPQPILNAVPFSEPQEFCGVRDTLKKHTWDEDK